MERYNENDLIKGIIENMTFVKNQPPKDADKCAGSIRSALEDAVKLFWLKKYEKVPVWVKNGRECFDLFEAISDPRFSKCFDKITISYMHMIRTRCNEALHSGTPLTVNETAELFSTLDKCIRSIEKAIPLTFLVPLPNGDCVSNLPQTKKNDQEGSFMHTYEKGDRFEGVDCLEMLNNAWGTHLKVSYRRCYIELNKLGYSDKGIAWVVFMDGKPHGPNKKYLWANRLSPDGMKIEEEYVGNDKPHVRKNVDKDAIRVAFRRDPMGTGEDCLCEFVGVFRFVEYRDTAKGFIRVYEKADDRYPF